ncbi:MAG: HhH-GPD-type base excision DNA repair protein [Actinomycetota bacterium]
MSIQIAQDPAADQVLSDDPFALLMGMVLDQQFPMERAFAAPATVLRRFGSLNPVAVAQADPEAFKAVCSQTPAIHRFPSSMAGRIQELARVVVDDYNGDASQIWRGAVSGTDLFKRLLALPGFGKQKAQIFIALVAKQLDVQPDGWAQTAGDYALPGFRSVADVVDPSSLQKVRQYKQASKAAS